MLTEHREAGREQRREQVSALVPGDLANRVLRQAVQKNLVSFPSQVPVFRKQARPDLQQKLALLYFVCGWTMDELAERYGLGRQRMGQILTAWRTNAVKEGYIVAIEPAIRPSAATQPVATQDAMPRDTEFRGLSLAEQLDTLVDVLSNQLRICSRLSRGSIDACHSLLARAEMLCARLESQTSSGNTQDDQRMATIVAAKELFHRFQ